MDLQLQDKVIIVSGGARGIGEGITRVLSAEKAIPVIVGRNESDNQKLVEELTAAGGKAFAVTAELVEPAEAAAVPFCGIQAKPSLATRASSFSGPQARTA